MEKRKIIKVGFYDEKKKKFFIDSSLKVSFQELYKNPSGKIMKDEVNNELITKNKLIYIFNKPHIITFTFPEGEKKEIFLANMSQLLFINKKVGREYREEISDDGINYSKSDDNFKSYESKYIKYVISDINEEDYEKSIAYISSNENLGLKYLSLNYKYYLENSNLVNNPKEFFLNTDERKDFFKFLNDKIVSNKYLALCGLEGIGKTASILAYLKYYSLNSYFYFNVKAIEKLLLNNQIEEIRKILLTEAYHCIEFIQAREYYDMINKILEKNHSAMDILNSLFKNLKDFVEIIVIDQYKTQYDENYITLNNILNSGYKNRIIIVSSMNEDDLRKSIIKSIKWALKLSNEKLKLDYYYIIDLVKVSEEDKNALNDIQKKLLVQFGNLYSYYYKIINLNNSNNGIYNIEISFKNEIRKEMDNKLQEFFYNRQSHELLETLKFLIMSEAKEISLKDCYKYINQIPLRYFSIKYKDNNIIHFSELEPNSKVSFNSAFGFIKEYFLFYFHKILVDINKNKIGININNEINQKSIDLENFFSYFLWGFRNVIKLNNTNIVDYIKVNSILEIKDNYISNLSEKINILNANKSILIIQNDQNAIMFDVGIIEKKKGGFNLYLFQITKKKKSYERLTLTGLNDNINYLDGFLSSKLNIQFKNNYFCYIFNYNDQDKTTISFCQQNNIDYLLFDSDNLILHGGLILTPLSYHLPVFKYSETFNKVKRMIDIKKLRFPSSDKILDINLEETKKFLQRKRELMGKKDLNILELENLKKYEKSLNKGKKVIPINYERREFLINNYLLSTEYKNRKIYGITYKKKTNPELTFNQKQIINLFQLCGKNIENDAIFQVDKIDVYGFEEFIPEFGCYIIFLSRERKKFYFDFVSYYFYDLDDKTKASFKGTKIVNKGVFYSLMILDKNTFV